MAARLKPAHDGERVAPTVSQRVMGAIEALEEFERAQAPHDWTMGGIHIWPIIKYLSASVVLTNARRGPQVQKYTSSWRANVFYSLPRSIRAVRTVGTPDVGWLKTGDVLFWGNATSVASFGDRALQVHFDHLRWELDRQGVPTRSGLAGISELDLASRKWLLPHQATDPILAAIARNTVDRSRVASLPGLPKLLATIVRLAGLPQEIDLSRYIGRQVALTIKAASTLEDALRTARPRSVVIQNYTNFHGWGMAAACAHLGIPCYEIQHGLQGRYHGGFSWKCRPAQGFNVVPGRRIVWTPADKATAEKEGGAGEVCVAGPGSLQTMSLLMERRAGARGEFSAFKDQLLNRFRPYWAGVGAGSRPRVLFLGQGGDETALIDALSRSKAFEFHYRRHPSQKLSLGSPNGELANAASELPLAAVLPGMDCIVSESSASFIEARNFDVPSVFFGDYADIILRSYAEPGAAGGMTKAPLSDIGDAIDRLKIGRHAQAAEQRFWEGLEALPSLDPICASLASG